jgi:hypothetical protein
MQGVQGGSVDLVCGATVRNAVPVRERGGEPVLRLRCEATVLPAVLADGRRGWKKNPAHSAPLGMDTLATLATFPNPMCDARRIEDPVAMRRGGEGLTSTGQRCPR